jgi:tRNA A37 threonylcarbamoyladenosine modification protein TsaB
LFSARLDFFGVRLDRCRRIAFRVPLPQGLILGIETSNPSAWEPGDPSAPGVALAEHAGGSLRRVGVEPIRLDRPGEDDLVGAIDRLCRRVGVRPGDLRAVTVSVGPGGYTALRIAVAVGKMVAEATGAGAFGVPTAHAVARRAPSERPLAICLASKNESAWVVRFVESLRAEPGRLLCASDLESLGVRILVADSFLPRAMVGECERLGVRVVRPVFDPHAVIEAAQDLEEIDPVQLLPIYAREPEAVTKWRSRRGLSA